MRFLVDTTWSPALVEAVPLLLPLGHDAVHATALGLGTATDRPSGNSQGPRRAQSVTMDEHFMLLKVADALGLSVSGIASAGQFAA